VGRVGRQSRAEHEAGLGEGLRIGEAVDQDLGRSVAGHRRRGAREQEVVRGVPDIAAPRGDRLDLIPHAHDLGRTSTRAGDLRADQRVRQAGLRKTLRHLEPAVAVEGWHVNSGRGVACGRIVSEHVARREADPGDGGFLGMAGLVSAIGIAYRVDREVACGWGAWGHRRARGRGRRGWGRGRSGRRGAVASIAWEVAVGSSGPSWPAQLAIAASKPNPVKANRNVKGRRLSDAPIDTPPCSPWLERARWRSTYDGPRRNTVCFVLAVKLQSQLCLVSIGRRRGASSTNRAADIGRHASGERSKIENGNDAPYCQFPNALR